MKHLRRRVIIRQYDFKRMVDLYVPLCYKTATFVPITLQDLEHEILLQALKDDHNTQNRHRKVYPEDLEYPRNYLRKMQDYLYNEKYVNWFSSYDEFGQLWIQSKKNNPESILGWGTFEVDY